jgi:hypothetical protein
MALVFAWDWPGLIFMPPMELELQACTIMPSFLLVEMGGLLTFCPASLKLRSSQSPPE